MPVRDLIYAGIDGCSAGWVLILSKATNFYFGGIYPSLKELLSSNINLDRVLIDMPIGLSTKGHLRTLDNQLRKTLGQRHSTVFNPPCREALGAVDYNSAKEINRSVEGKAISKQSYYISNKIKELDNLLRERPYLQNQFIECHPELCFKNLNNGRILERKSITEGIRQRIKVLSKYYSSAEHLYQEILNNTKRKDVKADDILDAMCLCIVNQLASSSNLDFIHDPLKFDTKGIPMRIGYLQIN